MSWYDDDVRNIKVLHGSTDITAKVLANTLTIENILCDGQLSFGSCNSARAQLTTIEDLNLTGETLTIQFGNSTDGYANLGVFTVTYSSQKENSEEVTLTMYDVVKKFDTDISEWYNGLNFPMTLSAFRSALCNHIGVTVVSIALVNDDMTVYETISPSKLNGMDMLRYIGEINGVFPHATSTGTLEWVSLGTTTNEIPLSASQGAKSYVHKTYNTAAISKLCIRSEDGDVGVAVGTGTNCYYVTANVLVYGLSSTDLTTIGTNLYNKIQGISYNPSELTMKANPELPMGAKVIFNSNIFYILKRSTKGLLFDTIKADGNQYLKEETSVRSEIEQLRGKSNVLTRSIEETQSTIADVEEGLSTQITQTADTLQIQINELYEEIDGDIKLYYTQETPTLLNYPAWDFTYNIPCNDTVQLANDLAFEYNDTYYKKNLRSIAYDETDNITYRFIKSSGQWIWQEVSNTETTLILSRLSQVEATAEEVSIEVQEVRADLTNDYYTIVQTNSAITAESNRILTSVSGTYATQTTTASIQLSVQTLQNTKLNKTDLVSTINAQANVITLTSDYFTLAANGTITATGGTIGGWNFNSNSIYSTNQNIVLNSAGSMVGSSGGSKVWQIDSAGTASFQKLNIGANGARIGATLDLDQGTMSGGFYIGSSCLYSGMTSLADTTHNGIYLGTNGIALGKGAFKVTSAGALTTTNITATGGTIGGFTIGSSSISASGVNISTSGITLGSTFSVTNAGVLTATSGTIGGLTISDTGLEYSDGTYTVEIVKDPVTPFRVTKNGSTIAYINRNGIISCDTLLANIGATVAGLYAQGSIEATGGITSSGTIKGNSVTSSGSVIRQKQNGHTTYVVGSQSYDMELQFNGNYITVLINGTSVGRIYLSTT